LDINDGDAKRTGAVSPFVIAISEAGIKVVPGLANAGYVFSAWTAANTSLYVASRTLYGMCQGLTPKDNRFFWPFGRTRIGNGAPTMAILASCIFAPLAYLLCATEKAQAIVDVMAQMGTTGVLIVWGCQCAAFLRFYFGLKYSIYDRKSLSYPYKSVAQPFTAIFGVIACSLLLLFNGWDIFYNKPFSPQNFFAAYLWVCFPAWSL
jgi:amino acid transporter